MTQLMKDFDCWLNMDIIHTAVKNCCGTKGLINIPLLNTFVNHLTKQGILGFINTEYTILYEYWGKGHSDVTECAVLCHEIHYYLISDALKYRRMSLYQTSKAHDINVHGSQISPLMFISDFHNTTKMEYGGGIWGGGIFLEMCYFTQT